MLSSMIHHPCEIALHLLSEDIFIHPAPPNSELPGHDQTLRGVIEIKSPTERVITGLKVTLQAIQTLAIPDSRDPGGVRWEEKIVVDKSVEILGDGEGGIVKHHKNRGKGKGKEKSSQVKQLEAAVEGMDLAAGAAGDGVDEEKRDDGIHLGKGVHGFEFSFIIPASSPPFERSKHGRVRYLVTATALGAGRARHNISAWREIFVILNVDKHGGPTPLEITYADVHEALGPISLSLTAASLTVGGTVTLTVVHPEPPPKLNVHVIRVFCEQTFELYSETKKAWMKLPPEKLRVAEWGHMPNKPAKPLPLSQQVQSDPTDIIWTAEKEGAGKPGKGAYHALPNIAPYGQAIPHTSLANSGPSTPAFGSSPQNSTIPLPTPSDTGSRSPFRLQAGSGNVTPGNRKGYKLKATVRLPNDDHMRPSTVRGSRAEIRIGHEMGVEVFFSREDVLDTREGTENYGKPKVQVFSARRSVVVPSCTATFDTVHLPPYVQESPVSSRPPSPTNLARNQANYFSSPHHAAAMPSPGLSSSSSNNIGNHSNADLQKLAVTLHNTLPGGRGRPDGPSSGPHSTVGSRQGSRDPSPTRPPLDRGSSTHSISHSISAAFNGHFPHGMGRKSRPASRPSSRPPSPTHDSGSASLSTSPANAASHHPTSHRGRRFGSNFQGFTPAVATQTTSAPPSGAVTPSHHSSGYHTPHLPHHHHGPSTLAPNAPWGATHLPPRTGNSHDTCNCGRTTEELAGAEHRLLDGVPTAPGMFSETHGMDEEPPAWSESRPASPDYFSQVFANTSNQSAVNTPAVTGGHDGHGQGHGSGSGKGSYFNSPMWGV